MNRQGVPLVSILIPAFNAERWIAETIRSALSQTWPRIEVIVVDDGSGDATLAVARRFEAERVKVVGKANQGAAAARNLAFQLSRGDYIQWLDADDLLAPDKIERQLAALPPQGASSTLLSGSWAYFAYRPQRAVFVPTPLWEDLPPVEWLHRKMSQNLHMQTSTWLTNRELALAAGPWDETLTNDDDGEYFCRVLLASSGTRFVAESMVFFQNWSAEFDPCVQDPQAGLSGVAAKLGGHIRARAASPELRLDLAPDRGLRRLAAAPGAASAAGEVNLRRGSRHGPRQARSRTAPRSACLARCGNFWGGARQPRRRGGEFAPFPLLVQWFVNSGYTAGESAIGLEFCSLSPTIIRCRRHRGVHVGNGFISPDECTGRSKRNKTRV
jgi:hypothetical protein